MNGGDWTSGEAFNKSERRRDLQPKLNSRSGAAIEFKRQNISAALLDLGLPTIDGYKPARNYQRLVRDLISDVLRSRSDLQLALERVAAELPQRVIPPSAAEAFVERPTARVRNTKTRRRSYSGPVDFAELDARNRALGEKGEQFVVELEKQRLTEAGREDLAARVEWVSQTRGPSTGYDVASFDIGGQEIQIEVKTTNGTSTTPFLVSINEVLISKALSRTYRVYRVFHFSSRRQIFVLRGALKRTCRLIPQSFRATVA